MTDPAAAGIAAIKAGDLATGRATLSQVVSTDPDNAPAWLWLSAAVTTSGERRYCLEQVLRIIPNSPAAKKGLATLPRGVSVNPLVRTEEPPAPVVQVAPVVAVARRVEPEPIIVAVPPVEVTGPTKNRRRLIGLILVLIVLGALGSGAWYALQYPAVQDAVGLCPIQAYAKEVQPLAQEWQDAVTLAGSTSRIGLAPQVAAMQAIRRRMATVTVYKCAAKAHEQYLYAMDESILGFTSFMAQDPDGTVKRHFDNASTAMSAFQREMDALR